MARAGWLFSRHGMMLSRIGVHTCFIRYYMRILGSRLAVDCFVIFLSFLFYFNFPLVLFGGKWPLVARE